MVCVTLNRSFLRQFFLLWRSTIWILFQLQKSHLYFSKNWHFHVQFSMIFSSYNKFRQKFSPKTWVSNQKICLIDFTFENLWGLYLPKIKLKVPSPREILWPYINVYLINNLNYYTSKVDLTYLILIVCPSG